MTSNREAALAALEDSQSTGRIHQPTRALRVARAGVYALLALTDEIGRWREHFENPQTHVKVIPPVGDRDT